MAQVRIQEALHDANFVWQDRELRFNLPAKDMALRRAETLIDSINSVEDTKGNNGERGTFEVTNLRLMWTSHKRGRVNLSIGYGNITNISIKSAHSRLRGQTQALHLLCKHSAHARAGAAGARAKPQRFEFVFTSLVRASPRLFTTVQAVYRAYDTTKLYRELKLRGAIVRERQLNLLPGERVFSKVDGVWNLSSEQGNLGTLFVTNVRVVWHANLAENFNVSVPYMQIKASKVKQSKFGKALVISSRPAAGGYVLGFRIDPADRLAAVCAEIKSLLAVYSANPVFGVAFVVEAAPAPLEQLREARVADDITITSGGGGGGGGGDGDDDGGDGMGMVDPTAVYFAEAMKEEDRAPSFNGHLGLAVEGLPKGISVEQLWSVV